MSLTDLYNSASPCIIGFISRLVTVPVGGAPPLFPTIIGTGYFVTGDGVVATNRHVVEALWKLPANPSTGERVGAAFLFLTSEDKLGGQLLNVRIREVCSITDFTSASDWYGQDIPDIGFVQLDIRETPFLDLATEDFAIRPGMDISTMGYPLGDEPLILHGKVSQLGPFVRRGIVSSVYPFSCPQPHGFTIDIMQQGGSSGSPIFAGSSPLVVGMMWGGLPEVRFAQSPAGSLEYTLNTNISLAEPSNIVKDALAKYLHSREALHPKPPSLQELREMHPRPEKTTGFIWSMNPTESV